MKKSILFLTLLCVTLSGTWSQGGDLLSNKNGVPILPAAGDIGFGLSANPFFNYAGNLLSSSGSNQLSLALPGAIYGKYFLDSKTAIRVKLDVYRYANTVENIVPDDDDADLTVIDTRNYVLSDAEFTLGLEKRRGIKRLQLFYGGELAVRTGKLSYTYEYGNSHTIDNPTPWTTYDFEGGNSARVNQRPLEDIQKDGFGLMIRAFTGLEYFVLPKISVGGEFGLSYTRYFGGKDIYTTQAWDFADNRLESNTDETSSVRAITASDISSGRIFLLFYF